MFMGILAAYMSVHICTTSMPGAPGSQNRASDAQELKLWVAVNLHVGDENPSQVHCKSSQCS